MVLIDVSGTSAIVRKQDDLTSGMVGATVTFCFSDDWDGLAKTVVFRAGKVTKDATVMDSVAKIPHEVLAVYGIRLEIGVYGTADNGSIVVPTVWAKTNPIKPGTDPSGDESLDPSLPVWAQMQEQLGSMYRSSEEIKAAKEEMLQAVEDGKEAIQETVAAGGYHTKAESGSLFASIIKGEMSGSIVAADDVSSGKHTLSAKAYCKNLFNNTDDFIKNGTATYSYGDGILNISGSYVNKWMRLEEGKTYTFSAVSSRTGNSGGGIYIRLYEEDKVNYKLGVYDTINLSPACTFTTVKGYPLVRFTFYGSTQNNAEESATYTNIQLEEGTEATAYEPYFDPSVAMVHQYGKNLIQYPFSYSTRTINGVTFTPKTDGSVKVSGTATANTYFALNGGFSADAAPIPCTLKPGVEYTITDAMVFLYSADGETTAFNEGSFTMPEGYDYYGIFVYVPAETTVAETRRPQLEVGGDATDFETYTYGGDYSVLDDGTVEGVASLAPCMTLTTDRNGMLLKVEYNRDTNKVIEDLLNQISPAARISSVKLVASKWKGSENLYSQVVSIAGVTENSRIDLAPSVEQLAIFYEKDITFVTENDGGVVTVYVIGEKPQNDYTIQADIVEVIA